MSRKLTIGVLTLILGTTAVEWLLLEAFAPGWRIVLAPPSRGRPAAHWVRALGDEDEFSRWEAAEALGELGSAAAPAVPALIRTLKSTKPLTAFWAGSLSTTDPAPPAARKALVRIGRSAVPALTQALTDRDPLTRVHAAWALSEIEGQAGPVLPVLWEAWREKKYDLRDRCIRYAACDALGEIGWRAPDQVLLNALEALKGDDDPMVDAALRTLRIMARKERQALMVLVEALADRRDGVGNYGGWALREVGPAAVPLLVIALKGDNPRLRWRAAWTLGGMPKEARAAIPALREALRDPSPETRKWADWALKAIDQGQP